MNGEFGNVVNLSGGGVGGSIVICVLNFDGEGYVMVNGGFGFLSICLYGGSGVGGCIVVYYNGNYIFIGLY